MPYRPNVPQPTDLLKNSQNDFLEDFQAINGTEQVDHEPFLSENKGKHKVTRFPVQGSSPATAANEIALFSRVSANPVGFGNVLCLRQPNNGAVNEFSAFLNAASGWTRLPNGNLLKWFTTDIAANFTGTVAKVWPVAADIPVFSGTPEVVMIIPKQNGSPIRRIVSVIDGTQTNLGFTLYVEFTRSGAQAAFDVYIIGIGRG